MRLLPKKIPLKVGMTTAGFETFIALTAICIIKIIKIIKIFKSFNQINHSSDKILTFSHNCKSFLRTDAMHCVSKQIT